MTLKTFTFSSRIDSASLPAGRLHGDVGHDLQQVVLDHVADRPGFFVERAATLHAEDFGHRNLHTLDVVAIPDRLEDLVGEAEEEQVLHGRFAEVVVDAEDRLLVEVFVHDLVERERRGQVAAEGLFEHHAGAGGAFRFAELLGHGAEEHGRDCQVVGRMLGRAELLAKLGKRGGIVVVAVDVAEQSAELGERGGIELAMLLDAGLGAGF